MIQEIDFQTLSNKLYKNQLSFYNVYNIDNDLSTNYTKDWYLQNPNDNIENDQFISKLLFDIEVDIPANTEESTSVTQANFPINAITLFSTIDNSCYSFFLHSNWNVDLEQLKKDYHKFLIDNKYILNDIKLNIWVFDDEKKLLSQCCNLIKQIDPMVIAGWYSNGFDVPYLYNRLKKLFGYNETCNLLSHFGKIEEKYNEFKDTCKISIPDYVFIDMMELYMPREDGGLAYGKKLPSFSLNYVCKEEIELQKLEYAGNLNLFYLNDPTNFFLYNIVDVILLVRLENKLGHIDAFNIQRRLSRSGASNALIGMSGFYKTFMTTRYHERKKSIRYGLIAEKKKTLNKDKFNDYYKPIIKKGTKTKKIELKENIDSGDYLDIICKFDGAYVKQPKTILINGKFIVIDLDASRLYPSMIVENNISLDTFECYIINPIIYKFVEFLENNLGKTDRLSTKILDSLTDAIVKYVDSFIEYDDTSEEREFKKKKNKGKSKDEMLYKLYFIITLHLTKLFESRISFNRIVNPTTDQEAILLNQYLLPLFDVMTMIKEGRESYNDFCYDYIWDGDLTKYKHIYVVQNVNKSNKKMVKLSVKDTISYIQQFIITPSGCCFTKHNKQLGLSTELLLNCSDKRDEVDAISNKYSKELKDDGHTFTDSKRLEYILLCDKNSRLAKNIKVYMNSLYGVYGLKTYPFANHLLAHAITTCGKASIKIATALTDKYIQEKYKK